MKKEILFLLFIFIFSFFIRVSYNAATVGLQSNLPKRDAGQYHEIAVNIIEGKGYSVQNKPSAVRLPVLPFFLALVYAIFGQNELIARLFLALFSCTTPLILFFLAKNIFNNRTAYISAWWGALYPFFVHEASMYDTENIFIPLLLLSLFFLIKALPEKNIFSKNIFLAGICFGLTSLTREAGLYIPLLLLLLSLPLSFFKKNLAYIKKSGVLLVIFFIFITPWVVRNLLVMKTFIPSTTGGMEVYLGSYNEETFTNPKVAGNFVGLYTLIPQSEYDLLEQDKTKAKKVLFTTLKKYWHKIPWLTMQKLKWFWHFSPKHPDNRNLRDDIIGFISYGWLIPFFVFGYCKNIKDERFGLLLAIIGYFTLISMATYGSTRLRLPIDGLLLIVGLHYALQLFDTLKRKIIHG